MKKMRQQQQQRTDLFPPLRDGRPNKSPTLRTPPRRETDISDILLRRSPPIHHQRRGDAVEEEQVETKSHNDEPRVAMAEDDMYMHMCMYM
jgi:hypothetical protein